MLASIPGREEERKRGEEECRRGGRRILGMEEEKIGKTLTTCTALDQNISPL